MDFSFEKFCIVVLRFVQRYQTMQIINLWKVFFHAMLVKGILTHTLVQCALVSTMQAFLTNFSLFSVPMILVSTGYPRSSATKTEIINTDNSGLTCKDLEEYPLEIIGAVGFNVASAGAGWMEHI